MPVDRKIQRVVRILYVLKGSFLNADIGSNVFYDLQAVSDSYSYLHPPG